MRKTLLSSLGVILLTLPCLAQQTAKTYRVPFRSVSDLVLLDLKVNGKPAVLMLDTGANISLFRNATNASDILVEIQPDRWIAVTAVSMGELGIRHIKIAKSVGNIDGILGQSFLRHFQAVRIDFKNHVLELESDR